MDNRSNVTWQFCLVFPEGGKKEEENLLAREAILGDIAAAGLETSLFYSSTKQQVFCKVGASEERLLLEADILEYPLKADSVALKQVTESNIDEKYGRGAIFLDHPYPKGVDIPHQFLQKDVLGNWNNLPMSSITKPSKLGPFEFIYAKYNDEWEKRILSDHGVQIYAQQEDGTILRPADRIKLIKKALQRSSLKDPEHGLSGAGLDLQSLLFKKTLAATYPLQIGAAPNADKELTPDQLLAAWNRSWPWSQPLEDIRAYCGEKITLYFAFLGHLTTWLLLPSFLGAIIFAHQLIQLNQETGSVNFIGAVSSELVDVGTESVLLANGSIAEVPVFKTEIYTQVDEAPFFALFISLWATALIEFWKRKQARLAMEWGTSDLEQVIGTRVQFKASHIIPDPVTGQPMQYYSQRTFLAKLAFSASIIFFSVVVVVSAIGAILIFKVVASSDEFDIGIVPAEFAPQLALIVNALAIIVLGTVYKKVAKILNDFENHKTDIEYEDHLIAKTFVFSFINSYATLTYFAFIKSGIDILGVTQVCVNSAALRIENATDVEKEAIIEADLCYASLSYSLFIIFFSQIVVNNIQEVGIPYITAKVKALLDLRAHANLLKAGVEKGLDDVKVGVEAVGGAVGDVVGLHHESSKVLDDEEKEDIEIDMEDSKVRQRMKSPLEMQLFLKEYDTPFDDYLEIALQFGYVSLFVAAFPIAPFLALLNNVLEVKVDSYKVCILSRRPEMPEAADIGTWQLIFQIMGFAAVISNASVILFTGNFVGDDVDDSRRVWLWVLFIAVVMSLKVLIDFLVPDVPGDVAIQLKRQEFLVRKVFNLERDDEGLSEEDKRISRSRTLNTVVGTVDPYIGELMAKSARIMRTELPDFSVDELFDSADVNNDHELSLKELRKKLENTEGLNNRLNKFEIKILTNSLDIDGDGTITKREFKRAFNI